jgi:hypothetical protein
MKAERIEHCKNQLDKGELLSLRSPVSFETKRQREVFLYLCENDGVDQNFRAHPQKAVIRYDDLAPALKAAKKLGFCAELKPYHVSRVKGLWEQQNWIDEIILKRVDTLCYGRYGGELLKLCAHVQAREFLQPLEEVIKGKVHRISVLQPLEAIYRASPYQIVQRYIEITGQVEKYQDLRPYHFSCASQGTYSNSEVAFEVVSKKIKSLLKLQYGGDFAKLCANVDQAEFLSPFIDRVAKKDMLVKMAVAAKIYNDSLYTMLKTYIEREGLGEKYAAFKPYHMSTASQATYQNSEYVKEVVVKSCKYQIANSFGGSESAFLDYGTIPQICQPFFEKIAGRQFEVCSDSAVKAFGERSTRIKKLYMKERNKISLLS